jgi:hypothetical protein
MRTWNPAQAAGVDEGARVMAKPWLGLSLMPEAGFAAASAPLFREQKIDAVEWSFDMGWGQPIAPWLDALLTFFSEEGRLFGHGVSMSPLSVMATPKRTAWLERFEAEMKTRRYLHVSEHYGCMTTPRFSSGAPIPMPRSTEAARTFGAAMDALRLRALCPVGIEKPRAVLLGT